MGSGLMSDGQSAAVPAYEMIDGFRCYAPAQAMDYGDYPSEGFDVTAQVEANSFWCRARNRVLNTIFARFANRERSLDMLEIGCGTGTVLSSLRTRGNLRLTGSEIYLRGLRYARTRLPEVEFIQLDATNIPFREAFDVVGAFDVLEHIDADELVMRQAFGALRPGGLFVVTVPQYQWMWSQLDELVHHKRRYSRRGLLAKLRAAGFDVVYTTSFVTVLFPLMAAARWRDRGRAGRAARAEFEFHVDLPDPLNRLFDWVMRIDEALLKAGLSLPFGGSLLAVARRPVSRC
jgi:SAM-dependent methyltransferase